MSYRDEVRRLGAEAEAAVLTVFDLWDDGELDDDEAVARIAAIIAKANSQAVTLADLSLAATLMLRDGEPVATRGIVPPPDDADRLTKAASTLLAISNVTRDRAARLGRCEPLEAAARAYSQAVEDSPKVDGWTRSVSGSGCELCTWWARDGQVWPADHPMPTHKGCTCTPIPA